MVRAPRIGLLDHMGGGNLGDDATQTAVIENIRVRWPNCAIYGFSMNPADTELRHKIPSYPIRLQTWTLGNHGEASRTSLKHSIKNALGEFSFTYKLLKGLHTAILKGPRTFLLELLFLVSSLRILRSFDLLIISGGGQLMDAWGGPWSFPYTIFKWVLLTRLAFVRCIMLNVGAGPLDHWLSRFFVRRSLSMADYISFRDKKSLALVRSIGFRGHAEVFPDVVYGLDVSTFRKDARAVRTESIVGIAPMAYGDQRVYPNHDPTVHEGLIRSLDSFGLWLSKNGYQVSLFCSDIGVDPPTVQDLKTRLRAGMGQNRAGSLRVAALATGADVLQEIASMEYVVTCRFHGVVFAHLLNVPVIAISHHPKIVTLMGDLGLSEYCVDIRECDADRLITAFSSLVRNAPAIKAHMKEKRSAWEHELSSQFDALFPQKTAQPMACV